MQTARRADPLRDVALLIKSRYAIIHLDTAEEERAEALLHQLAAQLGLALFVWKAPRGLRRADAANVIYGTETPAGALGHIEAARLPALYHFQGLGPALADADLVARLRAAAAPFEKVQGALVLTGTGFEFPETLLPISAVVHLPPPTAEDYRELLERVHRDLSTRMPVQWEMGEADVARLVHNLQGLTMVEAEKILTRAMVEDGKLSAADIQLVIEAKKGIVEREGLLEYVPAVESLQDVAGIAGLKGWLRQRRELLLDPERAREFGLTFPKGILILGVPGCGKSLCAKAVAGEWKLPLVKLDPANLYDKYVGESERNFKRALRTAERCAPVVLWIDELEKAFANTGADHDGGTSARVFGGFLTWLQDHAEPVFVVATANDVSRLPAEFLRKGRFDEIFFVDLPDAAARASILELQLRRRGQDITRFDLPELVRRTEGMSGAEIEQCVVSALFAAFSARTDLTSAGIRREIAATVPLAVTMAERVAALRAWAQGRVRSAD